MSCLVSSDTLFARTVDMYLYNLVLYLADAAVPRATVLIVLVVTISIWMDTGCDGGDYEKL